MRFGETLPVELFQTYSDARIGGDHPAGASPEESRRVPGRILLLLLLTVVLAGAGVAMGAWSPIDHPAAVPYPPAEWASRPPAFTD